MPVYSENHPPNGCPWLRPALVCVGHRRADRNAGSTMLSRRLRLGVALPLIALLWGVSLLPMVFTNQLWLACGSLLLGGFMWGPYTPMETTLLQRNVPREHLGRVFGARSTLIAGGSPLGLAIGECCSRLFHFQRRDCIFGRRLYPGGNWWAGIAHSPGPVAPAGQTSTLDPELKISYISFLLESG